MYAFINLRNKYHTFLKYIVYWAMIFERGFRNGESRTFFITSNQTNRIFFRTIMVAPVRSVRIDF